MRRHAIALSLTLLSAILGGCGSPTQTGSPATSDTSSTTADLPSAAPPTPTPVPEYQAYVDLTVGDCFNPVADSDDDSLLAGLILECDTPHLMEVFGTPNFDDPLGEPYPGQAEADRLAEEACRLAFSEYVGVDFEDSRLSASFYTPPSEFWDAGDRRILCVVEATEAGPLTRSVKDSEL